MTASSSEKRKLDHWTLCSGDEVAFHNKTTLLEQVQLVHRALPELSLDEVSLQTHFLGKTLEAPLWVSSMTGGMSGAQQSNKILAEVAEKLGLGFCLGSMRPLLTQQRHRDDFYVRDVAPSTLVMCNIGGTELVRTGAAPLVDLTGDLGADGLIVHLNPAMELIQPGGDQDFKGVLEAIEKLALEARGLSIVVKETGAGLSFEDAASLVRAGVKTVEVGGAGGTSWVGVETLRAHGLSERVGRVLWDWGIPTAVSTKWCVDAGLNVVASGGIRTGQDIAKALALGAQMAGVAAPLVACLGTLGAMGVENYLTELTQTLKSVMLLVGVGDVSALGRVPKVLGADLGRWVALSTRGKP